MFKSGDNIILIDIKGLSLDFNIGDKFIVNKVEFFNGDREFVNITGKHGHGYVGSNHFKLSVKEQRKQKLLKLCSSQETE